MLELAADGGPTRVRYTFARPLEHPSQVFLLATKRGMIRYPMGPVGSTVVIPPAALPLPLDLATKDGL